MCVNYQQRTTEMVFNEGGGGGEMKRRGERGRRENEMRLRSLSMCVCLVSDIMFFKRRRDSN